MPKLKAQNFENMDFRDNFRAMITNYMVVTSSHICTIYSETQHTYTTFHPLSTIVIHTLNLCEVKSMDDNCGEWVECMGVTSWCGEQEACVASGSGWNLWVWLAGGECV